MSEFLERNKKKSLWLALLLLFRRGKSLLPLVLLLLLLGMLFVLPAGFLGGSLPWLERAMAHFGLGGFKGGTDSTARLDDALRSARRARFSGVEGSASVASGRAGSGAGADSKGGSGLGYVTGGREIYDEGGRGRDGVSDKVARAGGKSVEGVLNADDADKFEKGVPVDEDKMREALQKSFSGLNGTGTGDVLGVAGPGSGMTSRAGIEPGKAVNGGAGLVSKTLGSTPVPVVGKGTPKGFAGQGNLKWRQMQNLRTRMNGAAKAMHAEKSTVMYQLAEGRAYSVAAAPPPGGCPPPGCPGEYASNSSGVVFDGGAASGQLLTSGSIGEGIPITPTTGDVQTLIDEANKMEEDARKCEEAERDYGPRERASMDKIQSLSDEMSMASCNSGGCSKSKYNKCRAIGDRMKAECWNYNSVSQQKMRACPLMSGSYSQMNCNQ